MKRLHMAITIFVQLFGTSITLLHLLMPLMLSSFFIHPEASIGVL